MTKTLWNRLQDVDDGLAPRCLAFWRLGEAGAERSAAGRCRPVCLGDNEWLSIGVCEVVQCRLKVTGRRRGAIERVYVKYDVNYCALT